MSKQSKWINFKNKYLKDKRNFEGYYVCVNGHWTKEPEVDHIIKRSLRPDLVFDESNLQILCYDCHRAKHK